MALITSPKNSFKKSYPKEEVFDPNGGVFDQHQQVSSPKNLLHQDDRRELLKLRSVKLTKLPGTGSSSSMPRKVRTNELAANRKDENTEF